MSKVKALLVTLANVAVQRLIALRPMLRRIVPRRLHHRVGTTFRAALRAVEASRANAVPALPRPPVGAPRSLPPIPGLVLHVTESLGCGGAERQLAYLLKGQAARCDPAPQLVGFRLGESPEFDHFAPALAGTGAVIDTVTRTATAERRLAEILGPDFVPTLGRDLAWAPDDVADDIVRLAAEIVVRRADVVHGWQDSVGIAAAIAGLAVGVRRVVISTRNVSPPNFSYDRPYMRVAYQALAAEPNVVLINNSRAGADDYAAWLGVPPSRFVVVRNGIAPAEIVALGAADGAAFRARLGVPPDAPLVGGVFRLHAEKRPLLWLEVAARVRERLPAAHFVIVGDGPMRPLLLQEAGRRGMADVLHLPGAVRHVGDALAAMTAFLLVSAHEGTPNVVIEASLAGVPVVATDAGGTAETIADGVTGIVVRGAAGADEGPAGPPNVAETIADKVLEVLRNPAWTKRCREAGPRFVLDRFGLERMIVETTALYG
ncbi:glycosyltransferase [Rhodoplanes azumiensis]|uniref:Glycosyltransferase n=1 Tax=Rhodoplanes azumiensis TaxID=1897628 RepID=A0ABW5AJU6_9BRAD